MTTAILLGDCRMTLATLADRSVQTCVTSPPYFGLRDYGTATWEGGDPECAHTPDERGGRFASPVSSKQASNIGSGTASQRDCRCGAVRVDAQIGLEETPDAYVANLVSVFREVRRVLRDDGTLWLNLGDSYATGGGKANSPGGGGKANSPGGGEQGKRFTERAGFGARGGNEGKHADAGVPTCQPNRMPLPGLNPKDLIGIPWRVAFALQADGWYLRSDIIWHKPNPMPESVTDRPTKSHEYLFLLSKSPTYLYDADAIAEPAIYAGTEQSFSTNYKHNRQVTGAPSGNERPGAPPVLMKANRNRRTVWTVATQPFKGAHFATFPPALIEPCILAGSAAQACETCGAAWGRVVDRVPGVTESTVRPKQTAGMDSTTSTLSYSGGSASWQERGPKSIDRGFAPRCDCETNTGAGRSIVLDPFGGAGTTGLVADRLGRDAILCELNPTYAEMARRRITDDAPLFTAGL